MRKRLFNTTVLAAIAIGCPIVILVSGCGARFGPHRTQDFHETYTLAPDGQFALSNVNGNVHITGWNKNQVEIDAVKSVWEGTALTDVKIDVESEPNAIRIETRYPHSWFGGAHASVDYTVMAPVGARVVKVHCVNGRTQVEEMTGAVSISSVNGDIQARDLSGEVQLSTVNGRINVRLNVAGISNLLAAKTVNGPITVALPPNVNATLNAHTINGGISCDFPTSLSGGFVGHTLKGMLGAGGGEIRLNTVNGHIAVRRAAAEPI